MKINEYNTFLKFVVLCIYTEIIENKYINNIWNDEKVEKDCSII
jgi:hypothetical protein